MLISTFSSVFLGSLSFISKKSIKTDRFANAYWIQLIINRQCTALVTYIARLCDENMSCKHLFQPTRDRICAVTASDKVIVVVSVVCIGIFSMVL